MRRCDFCRKPFSPKPGQRGTCSTECRFWVKVTKGKGCWPWSGRMNEAGYGYFWLDGKPELAHRVAFFLKHGRWPEPCCLHTCDNPPCCNPAHFFEGTNLDNALDRTVKNRAATGSKHGSKT